MTRMHYVLPGPTLTLLCDQPVVGGRLGSQLAAWMGADEVDVLGRLLQAGGLARVTLMHCLAQS